MERGFVRIIGGTLRGRKLKIVGEEGLRPSPDRVRETLFNWLRPYLPGARCLDLFAGTGVLGFEAISEGAAFVDFVDRSPLVIAALKDAQMQLRLANANIYQGSSLDVLKNLNVPFDIVFLDPPYNEHLLIPTCFALESQQLLKNPAYIYLEGRTVIKDNELPPGWRLMKSGKAGQVAYYLAKREIKR